MTNEKTEGREDRGQRSDVGDQRSEGQEKEENKPLFREDGIRKFQEYFQRALALAPRQWKKAVERTWAYFPDDAVVMGIVPENDDNMKSRVLKYLATTEVSEPAKN